MKLEGSLDAFGLPDIFQLLSFTKKTGGLRLRQADVAGVVYFAAGQVTGATADLTRQSLVRRLIGGGAVADEGLVEAVRRARADSTGVARALLDAGLIDADALRAAASEHTYDAVFELLRWPEGDFAFAVDDVNPDDVGVVLGTEQLVSEANSRRAAFEAASAVIPSPDCLLAWPSAVVDGAQLTREDWALLALVDGRRRANELIELTGRGSVSALSGLADLVQRGLLEVSADGANQVAMLLRRFELLAPLESPGASVPAPPTAVPIQPKVEQKPEPEPEPEPEPVARITTIGGPHVPQGVIPARPEPYLPTRKPEHADQPATAFSPAPVGARAGLSTATSDRPMQSVFAGVNGSAAMAVQPEESSLIERDPNVSRSLLLRLIAGVRGL